MEPRGATQEPDWNYPGPGRTSTEHTRNRQEAGRKSSGTEAVGTNRRAVTGGASGPEIGRCAQWVEGRGGGC